jgi:phosphoenolpyruvate carboxykinase (ATP)
MSVTTGIYTGRSPKDRFLVQYAGSETDKHFDWNSTNMPASPETFEELYKRARDHMNSKDNVYCLDAYVGASPGSRRKVRFITEYAWHQHFFANMMIRITDPKELENFEPDFTIINVCSQVVPDWKEHNLHSETAVLFNADKKIGVIFGTEYGGEMKKGIFGLMNYWLPNEGKLPMHCSANVGKDGSVALFFGLSGTGKTTLSADPHRALIGDDEHGWDDDGIFNFEGGCYAKTINLTEETEPDIYHAIKTDALFEKVKLNASKLESMLAIRQYMLANVICFNSPRACTIWGDTFLQRIGRWIPFDLFWFGSIFCRRLKYRLGCCKCESDLCITIH